MKRVILFALLLLITSTVAAQSDCQPGWNCGSVPLMGVIKGDGYNTDGFMRPDVVDDFFIRVRPVPTDEPWFLEYPGGLWDPIGAYDLPGRGWGYETFDGILIVDYASEAPVDDVSLFAMQRSDEPRRLGRTQAVLLERGCYEVAVPWSGGHTEVAFQVYNPDESENQAIWLDFDVQRIVYSSPLGSESFIRIGGVAHGSFLGFCIGDELPFGIPINPDLPLWVLPRFKHGSDFIVSEVWPIPRR